ncbi:MAG: hypothetical protein V5A46_01970 [Haloferacaceae archaeon]
MTSEEELHTVADALESSLAVVGCGPRGTAAADAFGDAARASAPSDPGGPGRPVDRQAIVAALALADVADELGSGAGTNGEGPAGADSPTLASLEAAFRDRSCFAIVLASVPSSFGGASAAALDRVREAGDAVVLVRDGELREALAELLALVGDTGVVNLDLADVRTLLSPDGLGVLSRGSAPSSNPKTAVADGLRRLVSVADVGTAGGALVDVVGTPQLSVDEAAALVDRVRSRLDDDAHVIWGTAVEDAPADQIGPDGRVLVRLLISDVDPPEPTLVPGDPCPRCGGRLSGYSLGERTTIACDGCGYAGVSNRRE